MKVAIVGLDDTPRWHPIWSGNPVIATPEEASREPVRKLRSGPNCRPYIVYPFTKETGWTFNKSFRARDHVAKLYLTEAELERGREARAKYGDFILIEPYTKHINFRWPLRQWSLFIEQYRKDYRFVQHVHADSVVMHGVETEIATFREVCGLLTGARAYIRSESGLCHAAAALGVPQVTIWGGCMDPDVLGGYPKQVSVSDRGAGSPCGRWLPCDHCTKAMQTISPARIANALKQALSLTGSQTVMHA